MKNTGTKRPASLAAAHGLDARLTMASLMAMLSPLPSPPKWHVGTLKPEHAASPSPRPLDNTFTGIRLYEKPGQVVDAWMFSDDNILRKYLNDELSELDLLGMIANMDKKYLKHIK